MIQVIKRTGRLFNSLLGRMVTSFWSVGVAAFAAFAFYQAVAAFEAGDRSGAVFLAIFGGALVILANVTDRAQDTFTDTLRRG